MAAGREHRFALDPSNPAAFYDVLLTTRFLTIHVPDKDLSMMRFIFTLMALIALTVGCGDSSSDKTTGDSTGNSTTTANQVSFDVTGMT